MRLKFELEDVIDTSDGYLTISLAQGGGDSGAPIPPHHWFHHLTIADSAIVRAQLFLDRKEALEAVGLRE